MEYLNLIGESISYYKYILVLILSIIEGPVVMAFSGMLWKLSYFSFLPLYLSLMAGDLIADTFWYFVGYFAGYNFIKKYGLYFNISEDKLKKFNIFFTEHQSKILFLSKITMGFGFALLVLIAAGISKVPFKKYISINFLGQIIWTLLLMILGYFFGSLYLVIHKSLRFAFIILIFIILVFLIYGLNSYMKRNVKI